MLIKIEMLIIYELAWQRKRYLMMMGPLNVVPISFSEFPELNYSQ